MEKVSEQENTVSSSCFLHIWLCLSCTEYQWLHSKSLLCRSKTSLFLPPQASLICSAANSGTLFCLALYLIILWSVSECHIALFPEIFPVFIALCRSRLHALSEAINWTVFSWECTVWPTRSVCGVFIYGAMSSDNIFSMLGQWVCSPQPITMHKMWGQNSVMDV